MSSWRDTNVSLLMLQVRAQNPARWRSSYWRSTLKKKVRLWPAFALCDYNRRTEDSHCESSFNDLYGLCVFVVLPKPSMKRPWFTDEKGAGNSQLEKYIKGRRVPGKEACMAAIKAETNSNQTIMERCKKKKLYTVKLWLWIKIKNKGTKMLKGWIVKKLKMELKLFVLKKRGMRANSMFKCWKKVG